MSSAQMREMVLKARDIQRKRFAQSPIDSRRAESQSPTDSSQAQPDGDPPRPRRHDSTTTNASMSSRQVRQVCKLDANGEAILKQAMTELGLSARAHDKVLRTSRTIADLEGETDIQAHHIAEAVQYRRLDRKL